MSPGPSAPPPRPGRRNTGVISREHIFEVVLAVVVGIFFLTGPPGWWPTAHALFTRLTGGTSHHNPPTPPPTSTTSPPVSTPTSSPPPTSTEPSPQGPATTSSAGPFAPPPDPLPTSTPPPPPVTYSSMSLLDVFRNNAGAHDPVAKQIGSRSFTYVIAPNLNSFMYDPATDNTLWQVASSTCRSLDLQVGVLNDYPFGDRPLSDTIKILGPDGPLATQPLPVDQVTTVHATLVPGQPFSISLTGSHYIFLNGSGTCTEPLKFSPT